MITIKQFVFNDFQENTYILSEPMGNCAIIDPGCSKTSEVEQLNLYIKNNQLTPVFLINTHGHIDHLTGVNQLSKIWNLIPLAHPHEKQLISIADQQGLMFGMKTDPLVEFSYTLTENTILNLGQYPIKVIHVPGHSPGHVALYSEEQKILITGDVLFKGSIGRTDLPGGDYDQLMDSILNKLIPLGPDVRVFPGHGPATNIGDELATNPFLLRLGN